MDQQPNRPKPDDIESKILAEHYTALNYDSYGQNAIMRNITNARDGIMTRLLNLQHPKRVLIITGAVFVVLLIGVVSLAVGGSHSSKDQLVASGSADGSDPTSGDDVDYGDQLSGSDDDSSDDDDTIYGYDDSDDSEGGYDDDSASYDGDDSYGDSDYYEDGDDSDTNDNDDTDQSYDEVHDITYDDSSASTIVTSPQEQGSGASQSAKVTKLLIFVEENHSYKQMLAGMPYTKMLAKKYGYANNYFGIRHPSLPNYIAIAGGATYGIANDAGPAKNHAGGSSIFGQAVKAGKSARVYADGMPGNCALNDGGNQYRVKHNPWAYFQNERASCKKYDVPLSSLSGAVKAGTLPNIGMVVPNMCHDAHDCSLGLADDWFKGQMVNIFKGADWKAGRLAIVLTADEDNRKSDNKVLTVVIHPSQKGRVVSTRLNHYSLSKLASQVTKTSPIKEAGGAPSMSSAFKLPL